MPRLSDADLHSPAVSKRLQEVVSVEVKKWRLDPGE